MTISKTHFPFHGITYDQRLLIEIHLCITQRDMIPFLTRRKTRKKPRMPAQAALEALRISAQLTSLIRKLETQHFLFHLRLERKRFCGGEERKGVSREGERRRIDKEKGEDGGEEVDRGKEEEEEEEEEQATDRDGG